MRSSATTHMFAMAMVRWAGSSNTVNTGMRMTRQHPAVQRRPWHSVVLISAVPAHVQMQHNDSTHLYRLLVSSNNRHSACCFLQGRTLTGTVFVRTPVSQLS
jgi:hypothetical protein